MIRLVSLLVLLLTTLAFGATAVAPDASENRGYVRVTTVQGVVLGEGEISPFIGRYVDSVVVTFQEYDAAACGLGITNTIEFEGEFNQGSGANGFAVWNAPLGPYEGVFSISYGFSTLSTMIFELSGTNPLTGGSNGFVGEGLAITQVVSFDVCPDNLA